MWFNVFTAFLCWLGVIFTGPVIQHFTYQLVSAIWPMLGQYATANSIDVLNMITSFFPAGYWLVGTILVGVGLIVSVATEG